MDMGEPGPRLTDIVSPIPIYSFKNLGMKTGRCGWLRSLQLMCARAVGNRGFANQRPNGATSLTYM